MARRATTRRRVQIRVRRWARGDARGSAHAASYRRAAHAWSTRRGRRRMSHRVHVARLVRGVRFVEIGGGKVRRGGGKSNQRGRWGGWNKRGGLGS